MTYFWCEKHKQAHRKGDDTSECLLVGPYSTKEQADEFGGSVRPELQALPKPLGYCIMADDGRMLWGENCIATDKSDLSGHLEIAQDDEPDDGWKIVPFYAAPLSASGLLETYRAALQKIADDYPRSTNEGAQELARTALSAKQERP